MRRTHHTLLDRGRGLDGEQLLEQGVIQTTAELSQEFRQHKVFLRTVHLHLPNPTRIHHR